MSGCGDYHYEFWPYVTRILSNAALDGDITASGTVTQGTAQSYFAGIDPADGTEFRAFLQFPLTGLGGIPGDAIIDSAVIDIVINGMQPNPLTGTIPLRIDLVDVQSTTLIASDFSRTSQPALISRIIAPAISQADYGQHVVIDVTSLMVEAQRLALPLFQVRILRDPGTPAPGLIEINDTTGANRALLAPLLEVRYF
jgi:hypothetical protein